MNGERFKVENAAALQGEMRQTDAAQGQPPPPEPRPLTPSLSPGGGEGVRRTGDGRVGASKHEPVPRGISTPLLNVTVPTFNEEQCLETNVRRLVAFFGELPSVSYEVVIADNGSTDNTLSLAHSLSKELNGVRVLHLDERGRGRALKAAWRSSQAQVLSYMDADLSSDLRVFPTMLEAVLNGRCDIAVGSRLLNPASTKRGLKREVMSRVYSTMVRRLFGVGFSDAQCGFKVIRREAAEQLLPMVEDEGWFFDTELLVLAERSGLRILDVPVPWVERKETRVELLSTILADLKGLLSLRRRLRRLAANP
jgi:glycosyltransferase involved in cell wall biosynthesis